MKKIIKPAEREEALYYSDFTGIPFGECGPDVVLKISFGYGSGRDGADLELHLNEKEVDPIIDLIKSKLSLDFKEEFKKKLNKIEENFNDSMQMRDWGSCDFLTNQIWFLRELLDIGEKSEHNILNEDEV